MDYKSTILQKIQTNTETVGIIGLGYVGLPLAVAFAEASVKTLGFDKNPGKVKDISNGKSYISDISDVVLREVVHNGKLEVTTNFSRLQECDAILICVPTPLDKFRKPDMSYIEAACTSIGHNMKPGTFICLESTTYPTTTEDFVLPIIEENIKTNVNFNASVTLSERVPANTAGVEGSNLPLTGGTRGAFWLAYSPERVDPGNTEFNTRNTPKILGALTPDGLEIGTAIYSKAIEHIHPVSSPRVAEMVKILENTYRFVNISLINELALLAGKMDINIWEVIEAAKTKPFGFQAFYPSPGIGGHCIPLDPFYLEHIAKRFDFDLSMIHTAGHINMRMPHYMSVKIATALNRHKKAINGSKILFLGVAYKPDISDYRESPALKIMDTVAKKGAEVSYHDPYIPTLTTTVGKEYFSNDLTETVLTAADVVVLTTNHSQFDVVFIRKHSRLIVDLRNMIKHADENVYKL
jgi:UDP-N-acetyl-D-glucosamine dehydrogenase